MMADCTFGKIGLKIVRRVGRREKVEANCRRIFISRCGGEKICKRERERMRVSWGSEKDVEEIKFNTGQISSSKPMLYHRIVKSRRK
jgi:hypothetical protein